jgi:hypothetical protein
MRIEKFQLRGNNSVCAGALHLLGGRAPAQLTGNVACVASTLTRKTRSPEDGAIHTRLYCRQLTIRGHLSRQSFKLNKIDSPHVVLTAATKTGEDCDKPPDE